MLDQLLQLEETHDVWGPEVLGIKLWPSIRSTTLDNYIRRELGYRQSGSGDSVRSQSRIAPHFWIKHARTLLHLLNPLPLRSSSVAFFTLGQDKLHLYFYRQLTDPLIIETIGRGTTSDEDWRSNRQMVLNDTFNMLMHRTVLKRIQLSASEKKSVRDFAAYTAALFNMSEREQTFFSLIDHCVRYGVALQSSLPKRLLKGFAGKIVFMREASYLSELGVWNKWLHEQGYTVVELQHGMLYANHFAYNFPASILTDRTHSARHYLPDLLLTFGEQWASQVRVPYRLVPIGFPYLSEMAQRLTAVLTDPLQILIVSEQMEKIASLTAELACALPDHRLIFKLHPVETSVINPYPMLLNHSNVRIVGNANIHELIAQSAIVIGETTTVLFEALAFPGKRIFVLQNDFMPDELGPKFSTVKELLTLIADASQDKQVSTSTAKYFEPNWQQRISDFLKDYTPNLL